MPLRRFMSALRIVLTEREDPSGIRCRRSGTSRRSASNVLFMVNFFPGSGAHDNQCALQGNAKTLLEAKTVRIAIVSQHGGCVQTAERPFCVIPELTYCFQWRINAEPNVVGDRGSSRRHQDPIQPVARASAHSFRPFCFAISTIRRLS